MEKIPSIMVIHNHVDGTETIFDTIEGPLTNNHLEKWLWEIRRGTYKAASEDSRWSYELVFDMWLDIEPDIYSSDYGLTYEGSKYQDKTDYQEH